MDLPSANPTRRKLGDYLRWFLAGSLPMLLILLGVLIFSVLLPSYLRTSVGSRTVDRKRLWKEAPSQDRGGPAPALGTIVFVDINLVPMDSERVVPHQTVVVKGRQIAAIGPATMQVPAVSLRVEGHGQLYLMPGLADMHSHASKQDDLTLYIANGVTTILTLGGTPLSFVHQTRKAIGSGETLGPSAYVAFFIDGDPPTDPSFFSVKGEDAARKAVDRAKAEGFEFIKVYNNLGSEEFHAIVDEARRRQLAVVGHAVRSVELKDALNGGQVMIAHGEEYIYMYFHRSRDLALAKSAADFTRATGAYVIPNLSAYEAISLQWGKPEQVGRFLSRTEAKYLAPCRRQGWLEDDYVRRAGTLAGNLEFLRQFTKVLSDRGVPLMLGTDSPNIPGMFAGYSIHDDLRNMVASGLTPYQALSAGTRVPGEFIKKFVQGADSFGTIQVGSRADLLLLMGNPLESIDNVRQPVGVMAAGRWMPARFLDAQLDRYAQEYATAACSE